VLFFSLMLRRPLLRQRFSGNGNSLLSFLPPLRMVERERLLVAAGGLLPLDKEPVHRDLSVRSRKNGAFPFFRKRRMIGPRRLPSLYNRKYKIFLENFYSGSFKGRIFLRGPSGPSCAPI
jgi:hypothetical protein